MAVRYLEKRETHIFRVIYEVETKLKKLLVQFMGPRTQWNYSEYHAVKLEVISTGGDISTSGLVAAILDLTLPVKLYCILVSPFGLPDPENMGLELGILLISCPQVEIQVLPVWRSPSCIFDFRLYAVVSWTGALGCWTPKI